MQCAIPLAFFDDEPECATSGVQMGKARRWLVYFSRGGPDFGESN
jgi:hypothetical protein